MARIATSIEESKRLLELGIDPNTADMSYDWIGGKVYDLCLAPCVNEMDIPAWSLGALLEVVWKVGSKAIIMSFHYNNQTDFIADLVDFIERLVNGCFKGKEE